MSCPTFPIIRALRKIYFADYANKLQIYLASLRGFCEIYVMKRTKNTSKAARDAGQNYRSTELHDDLVSTAPHALLRHGRVVSTYSTYEEAIAAMDAAEGNGWAVVPQPAAARAQFQPFNRVAFRGIDPSTAPDYISASPNLGYPMGYAGRLNGVVTNDQSSLRKAYFEIIAEAI
jgi:hypothetical protein